MQVSLIFLKLSLLYLYLIKHIATFHATTSHKKCVVSKVFSNCLINKKCNEKQNRKGNADIHKHMS